MSRMSTRTLASIAAGLALSVTLSAVPPDRAVYIGGTIPHAKEMTEGTLSTAHPEAMTFQATGSAAITIPYASITSIAYGQRAGRRFGWAVLTPLALFAKRRHHHLAVTYADGAEARRAEFELGKGIVRTTLKVLQVRTGKDIQAWALKTS